MLTIEEIGREDLLDLSPLSPHPTLRRTMGAASSKSSGVGPAEAEKKDAKQPLTVSTTRGSQSSVQV